MALNPLENSLQEIRQWGKKKEPLGIKLKKILPSRAFLRTAAIAIKGIVFVRGIEG
jgi:hypothetical protein